MYYAQVKFIDDKVGEILNTLKDLDLYNNTYIVWTADHGDQLGNFHNFHSIIKHRIVVQYIQR